QIWMAENLNYYDTLITPNLKESTSCSVDENECNETGRLYLWFLILIFTKKLEKPNLFYLL
ncbi:hypothetical protein II654_01020, partial [bacterium]|nr:hypothetical protein [bacterium]